VAPHTMQDKLAALVPAWTHSQSEGLVPVTSRIRCGTGCGKPREGVDIRRY